MIFFVYQLSVVEVQLSGYEQRSALLDNLMLLCMPVLCPGASTKLHSDSTFDYYKVAVASGVRMVEATTVTCRHNGMQAACKGPTGCNANGVK